MHDPVVSLRDAGCPVDQLNARQRDVLSTLTETETAMLIDVQQRLREADDGEVLAHELKLL